MAHNHYNVLDNGVQPWLPHGHARIGHDHRPAKDQPGYEARYGIKSPSFAETMNSPVMFEGQTRAGQRGQRARNQSNWAKSGPAMQAIFLGPKKNSCGTGVFIPRGQGTDLQFPNKPAFSPVLLPSRVIQALNLNVHELGQHIKPQSELGQHIKPQSEQNKNVVEKIDEKLERQEEDDVSFSPEIFLPKEWTY